MKKLILLLVTVILVTSYGLAQDDTRGQFHFGFKAGANLANVYDEEGEDFTADPKLGFVGGVFLAIPLGNILGIQPEILYSQKGFKAEGRLLSTNYGLTRTTSFIDVPLFVTIKPIAALSILAGPQFSYLLKRKDEFNSEIGTVEQIELFENDNIRKNILSIVAGLDFKISQLVIGARAGWDLSTNNGDGTSQTPRYKNAWLQATLGYAF